MSSQLKIYCENLQRYVDFDGGETLSDIASRLAPELPFTPICAMVNNKAEDMGFALFSPKVVRFLTADSDAGRRVYIRSLCMILYRAVRLCYPHARLSIDHSIGKGYYCRLEGAGEVTDDMVATLYAQMRRIVDEDIPFERRERLRSDVIELFRINGLTDKVRLLETLHELYAVYCRLADTVDSYYGAMAPSTRFIDIFDLRRYHEGFLLLGPSPSQPDMPQQPLDQPKMHNAFLEYLRFNRIISVSNVGELNQMVSHHRTADLINVAEALHDKKISVIADEIARRNARGEARIVLVAGPSSSGKTTTTKRLAVYLMTNLIKPVVISLDNYFVDRQHTPLDDEGEYDYESIHALDLKLFNEQLTALLSGEEVTLPTYNFETGQRVFKGEKIRLEPNSVLLIEGIHGLNPMLTAAVDDRMKFRVYVSALTTLSIDDHNWIPTSDNRLLRRIIRDHKYRGTSAVETIRRWPSVRRGEEKWIFPYQENADATFNSSLIFELGVMKQYGLELLSQVPHDIPEYAESHRLSEFLELFSQIPDRMIPPTSLLREFLGGSSFHY